MFDSIPVHDEGARRLATAVRVLDLGYRALRQQIHDDAGIGAAELDALASLTEVGSMTAKRLATATHLTTSATTALIDRMEHGGLLRRQPHPTDRRSVVLVPTARGREIVTAAWSDYVSRFEALLAARPCDGASLDDLLTSLECIAKALPAPLIGASTIAALPAA